MSEGDRVGLGVRILGLDPGSRVCGYGVIDETDGELAYVECGVLTAPEHRAMEDRLGEIARGLREVIAELAPAVVAVEDVFVRTRMRELRSPSHKHAAWRSR